MKNIHLITFISFCWLTTTQAQNINWNWLDVKQSHYAHLNMGYDFGVTTQVGYSYLASFKKPVLLTADFSIPMGKQLLDDYKFRLGGQVQALEHKNLMVSLKLLGNLKRHETALVRMFNLGVETSVIVGYYKPKWHVATEFGLIKPSSSHLVHSEIVKENFPSVIDGWYTSSGGHYFYGVQAGKLITNNLDFSLRMGATKALADHNDALIAQYVQIGLLKKF